ncbi:MAG: HAD family hydrolase [Candidatus Bathyarchaeales archaeon]
MVIKAVVFDLDGTLVKFNLDFKALRAETINYLTRAGFPASVFSLNETIFETLKKAEIYVNNSGKTKLDIKKIKQEVFKLAERYEIQAAKHTDTLPGVNSALKLLKKMQLKLGLFTINSSLAAGYLLEKLKLKQFFDAIVTRDSVEMVKPNPQHLTVVLRELGVKPKEAIIVGDSVLDMKSATELKTIGVGIPTGISTQQALIQAGATYIITSLTDLPTLVHQLNQAQARTRR